MKNINFLTFNVVFEPEADGGYSVSVPALPGCFSQGDNFEDALKNIKEAISLHLEEESEEEISYLGQLAEREFTVPVQLKQYA